MARVKSVTGTTLCVGARLSLAIAVLGSRRNCSASCKTRPDIQSSAIDYAGVTFASLPVLTVFFAYAYLLRGTGDAQTPFRAMALW
jgi:Na+-driven multidrug efflux pump